ncbi:MAG: mandelate racemase/muconate lactonizing enzyme family protein [bacterium]
MTAEITNVEVSFGRYPLARPLKISPGVIRDVPQVFVVADVRAGGKSVAGLGHASSSVLWADRRTLKPEEKESQLKKCLAETARKLRKFVFSSPFDFYNFFVLRNTSELPDLSYVMALSPIDMAIWDAYAKLRGLHVFDLPGVRTRTDYAEPQKVAVMHLISVEDDLDGVRDSIVREGISFFKIKLAGIPAADAGRVNAVCGISGVAKVAADANEAYPSAEKLEEFFLMLDEKVRDDILFLEQPFPRDSSISAWGFKKKTPIFADESYAYPVDIKKVFQRGYSGAAMKPHAKTFSGTLLALDDVRKNGMSFAFTDLTTAPPIGYAVGLMCGARLSGVGGVELNGSQYYRDWDNLITLGFPDMRDAFRAQNGCIRADALFTKEGWGISDEAFKKYAGLVKE